MRTAAIHGCAALAVFAVTHALLQRSQVAQGPHTFSGASKPAAPALVPQPDLPRVARDYPKETPSRATPLGRSLLDDVRWNDLKKASLSDPRAHLLTGALVAWVSRRARHCLPSKTEAIAHSAVEVVVSMSSTAEQGRIDGRSSEVRVIEGAPLDEKVLQCIRAAISSEDAIPLSSMDPVTLGRLSRKLPAGMPLTFPSGFRGSASMMMQVP